MSTMRMRKLLYVLVPTLTLALAACGSTAGGSAASSDESSASSSQPSGESPSSGDAQASGSASTPSGSSTSEGGESASSGGSASAALPDEIVDQGYVNVGTFPNYPPGQFAEEGSNDLVGWNMDLAKALADKLGVEFRMKSTTFDALIPGVIAKRFDFAMAEANITPERREQVDFVTYLNNGLGILVPKDSEITSTELSDMCGLTVGTNRGASPIPLLEDASQKCEADGKDPITVKTYNQISEAILAVKSQRIPVAVGDFQPISYAASQNPQLRLAGGDGFNKVTAGIIFPKGSPLEKPVQNALNSLIDDGTYQEILDKWGVGSAAVDQAELLEATK